MKKKIIIGIVIALAIIGMITYFIISDFMQEQILRNEVDKIGKTDIIKDNIDLTIRTKGDYAIIERTIKEYMNNYSIASKKMAQMVEDEQIAQILTAENYKNDGPEFIKTKEYITNTKKEFNENINLLIDMVTEEKMMDTIKEKELSDEFVDLYKELMLGNETKIDLQEIIDSLEQSNTIINNILDMQEKIINMLIENKGKWQINDNEEIEFESKELVEQYNQLISNL